MAWICVVTNAGQALLSSYAQGGHTLTLLGASVGSGTVSDANLRLQTTVSMEKDQASIIDAKRQTNGVKYKIQAGPASGNVSYVAHQIGLWAKLDSGAKTLLLLAQDSATGVRVPTASTSPAFAFALYMVLMVDNTEDLSVTIDESAYVSSGTLAEAVAGITPASIGAFGSGSLPSGLTDANDNGLYGSGLFNAGSCANLPTSTAGVFYQVEFMGRYQVASRHSQNGVTQVWARIYTNSQWYPWKRIDGIDAVSTSDIIDVQHGGTGASTAVAALQNLKAFGAGSMPSTVTDLDDTSLYGSRMLNANSVSNMPPVGSGSAYFSVVCMGSFLQIAAQYGGNSGVPALYVRYYTNSQWYPWTLVGVNLTGKSVAQYIQLSGSDWASLYETLSGLASTEVANAYFSAAAAGVLTGGKVVVALIGTVMRSVNAGVYRFWGRTSTGANMYSWNISGLTSATDTPTVDTVYRFAGTEF